MEGDEAGEAGFLRTQIAELREKKDGLYAERADYANQEVHIRILLELVEQMAMRPKKKEEKAEKGDGSCYDYEEFFRRTRRTADENMIMDCKVSSFSNEMVIRYLENVVVNDEDYEVRFKAGLTVSIPAK